MSGSKWVFALRMLVLCGGLTAASVWMILSDDPWMGPLVVQKVVGWLGVIFFGLGGLLAVAATVFDLSRFGLRSPADAAAKRDSSRTRSGATPEE